MEYKSSLRNRKTCFFLIYELIYKWNCLGWTQKIVRLLSPDQPNTGGADSKHFIEPLKRKQKI